MSDLFPRTTVGGLSVSRMIIGTNWFLGWSHTTKAKDSYIKGHFCDRKTIADVLEVFFRAGVDTIMAQMSTTVMQEAIQDAEDRTGVGAIKVSTPLLPISPETATAGFDLDEVARMLDEEVGYGSKFVMPHQATTDAMVDRCTREVRHMSPVCRLIRQRGMIPGLSTHMPETIVYADESGLDVATYLSIYNALGFLMQLEVDWVARIMAAAAKPVMVIKPMAAGRMPPFQAMHFVWSTLRPQDMVTVGTMSPQEAAECIELSLSVLERRTARVELQETRSKKSVKMGD